VEHWPRFLRNGNPKSEANLIVKGVVLSGLNLYFFNKYLKAFYIKFIVSIINEVDVLRFLGSILENVNRSRICS
jgi:hypothetical protein